jgi:site-specific DNA-methyltransferase (adenine-specific)
MPVLLNGDCLELMATIESGSIDMILCDLPYGTTACKWDTVIPFEPLWSHYKRVIKPNGAIVLFGSQPFTSALVMSNVADFKYCWVWEKNTATGHLNAKRMPMKSHEDVVVFGHSHNYFPQDLRPLGKVVRRGSNGDNFGKSGTENYQEFTNYPRSVLNYDSSTDKLHPTQKPVALLEYLIRTYTNEGETVLDNTMGSGTTGVACLNTGRNFIGIEKDQKYFEIARTRIKGKVNADAS